MSNKLAGSDFINIKQHPIFAGGDGVVDDTAAINAAITLAAGSSVIHFPKGTYNINSNITFTSGGLSFEDGAILAPAVGVTVTINQDIKAGLTQQIFASGPSYGLIRPAVAAFNKTPAPYVSVCWWGAKGDNATDSTNAIQATFNYFSTNQFGENGGAQTGTIYFPSGIYITSDTITFNSDFQIGINIEGQFGKGVSGDNGTFIWFNGSNGKVMMLLNGVNNSSMKGMSFLYNQANTNLLPGICVACQFAGNQPFNIFNFKDCSFSAANYNFLMNNWPVGSAGVLLGSVQQPILSSTAGTPVSVRTKYPHHYNLGGGTPNVTIVGHSDAGLNGIWDITVTGTNTFTLNGSSSGVSAGATGYVWQPSRETAETHFEDCEFTGFENGVLINTGGNTKNFTFLRTYTIFNRWGIACPSAPGTVNIWGMNNESNGPAQWPITAVSATNPVVITQSGHGHQVGETVFIQGASGTGSSTLNGQHVVTARTGTTFTFGSVNGVGWSINTSVATSQNDTQIGGDIMISGGHWTIDGVETEGSCRLLYGTSGNSHMSAIIRAAEWYGACQSLYDDVIFFYGALTVDGCIFENGRMASGGNPTTIPYIITTANHSTIPGSLHSTNNYFYNGDQLAYLPVKDTGNNNLFDADGTQTFDARIFSMGDSGGTLGNGPSVMYPPFFGSNLHIHRQSLPWKNAVQLNNPLVQVIDSGVITGSCARVTIPYTAWQTAGTSKVLYLTQLYKKTRIKAMHCDTTIALAGTAGTLNLSIGSSGSAPNNEFILAHDVKSGVVTKGLLNIDLGVSLERSLSVQIGNITSWTSATYVFAMLVSSSGNLSNLNAGSTTVYIEFDMLP